MGGSTLSKPFGESSRGWNSVTCSRYHSPQHRVDSIEDVEDSATRFNDALKQDTQDSMGTAISMVCGRYGSFLIFSIIYFGGIHEVFKAMFTST